MEKGKDEKSRAGTGVSFGFCGDVDNESKSSKRRTLLKGEEGVRGWWWMKTRTGCALGEQWVKKRSVPPGFQLGCIGWGTTGRKGVGMEGTMQKIKE